MSNKPEVERAAEVMRKVAITDFAGYAAAISADGLLRTDADRLNAELAEAMVAYPDDGFTFDSYSSPKWKRICDARNAILDARKPRWSVEVAASGGPCWIYCDGKNTSKTFPADAEPEARAYVARKNAEEAERAK